jgi:hypothetical protein
VAAKVDTAEREIAWIARRSHGIVGRKELLDAGLSSDEIQHRLDIGALIPVHRGVYRVGHAAPSLEARYAAAVKACGAGALLCGRAAAHLQGLLRGRAPAPAVRAPVARQVDGVLTSRCRRRDRRDATSWNGIPCTTVTRTVVDLAALLPPEELATAYHEAAVKRGVRPGGVEQVLGRRPNSRGAKHLRATMYGDSDALLSELEKEFPRRLRAAGLPLPRMNRRAGKHYIDCRWPDRHLTVELLGYRYHHTRHAWEKDHERQRAARARGDDFRTYTWGDVFETWPRTLGELRKALGP